jgi:hypothetical protein
MTTRTKTSLPLAKPRVLKQKLKADEKAAQKLNDEPTSSGDDPASEADDSDVTSLHSDALDDDSDEGKTRKRKTRSRPKVPLKSLSKKRRKKTADDDDEDGDDEFEVKDGQEVVGTIVQAPTTGKGSHIPYCLFNSQNAYLGCGM